MSSNTEVGLSTIYNLQTSNVVLGLVGKYTLDDGAVVKVQCTCTLERGQGQGGREGERERERESRDKERDRGWE